MDLGKLSELSHHRKCLVCGAEFESDENGMALEKFADHSSEHNPTAEQWNEAWKRIQAGKERIRSADQNTP